MNDLQIIVQVNEKVKQVVALSNRIFIVALNAMFQARRAKALGFNTVTGELRKFSADISESMVVLKEAIEFQVEFITNYQQKKHLVGLLGRVRTEGASDQVLAHLIPMEKKMQARSVEFEAHFMDCFRKFEKALKKAERACETGHSLYIHAKVEAQSAGENIGSLLQVVEQIESSVHSLDGLVTDIRSISGKLSMLVNQDATMHSLTEHSNKGCSAA